MAQVTVKKIAKIAGVSATTVSRCFHSPHLVRPVTLQRIQEAIREHNYVYNATAANFSRRRSSAVAVTIPTPEVSVFAQTLVGIQEVAFKRNSPLFVGNTHYDPILERGILRQCLEHRFGGIIMAGYDPSNEGQVLELMANNIPCIIIWEKPDNAQFDYVGIDKDEQVDCSKNTQTGFTLMDSLGLCLMLGAAVKDLNLILDLVAARYGIRPDLDELKAQARKTILLEREFNLRAGIGPAHDQLPEFFQEEINPSMQGVFDISAEEMQEVFK